MARLERYKLLFACPIQGCISDDRGHHCFIHSAEYVQLIDRFEFERIQPEPWWERNSALRVSEGKRNGSKVSCIDNSLRLRLHTCILANCKISSTFWSSEEQFVAVFVGMKYYSTYPWICIYCGVQCNYSQNRPIFL